MPYAFPVLLAASHISHISYISGHARAADAANTPKCASAQPLEPIPPKKDSDLRLFYAGGRGRRALDKWRADCIARW